MGRNFDLGKAAPSKPDALILNVLAVAPLRGAIPNGTSLKRSRAEFWSAYNIDFEKYVASDARGKLEAMGTALIGAINQVPDARMTGEQKRHFEAALMNGIALLLSEPDRMRRFQHPLQLE